LSARHGTPRPAGGTGDDFRAGIERAITRGWLWWHESSPYVKIHRCRRRATLRLPDDCQN